MWHLALVDRWEAAKTALVANDENARALVHVHGALAVYLVLALCARRGLAAVWPAGVVCALTFAGEAMDLSKIPDLSQSWVWRDTGGDIANSIVWPILITLVARWLAGRTAPRAAQGALGAEPTVAE